MSDVTRRLLAGGAGAVAAALAISGFAATAGLQGAAANAARPASVLARVPGAAQLAGSAELLPSLAGDSPRPAPAVLQRMLAGLAGASALGGSAAYEVVDAASGQSLAAGGPAQIKVPASTAKLLTATAALSSLGPATTLATRVVLAGPGRITLVGGGDVLLGAGAGDPAAVLGRAGLADLAPDAATSLRAHGTTAVTLHFDDTLFAGPAVNPTWRPTDISNGYVAPVQALEIAEGAIGPGQYPRRSADPALGAAQRFAQLLRQQGITVQGAVARGDAPAGAEQLAAVHSATVGELVEHALTESDNTVAEALGRLVAVRTGRPATFAGAGQAVLAAVGALGVPVDGERLVDASGLGVGSGVAPRSLTGVLALAASADHPQLRAVLSGLPVAGVSGTLADRFASAGQRSANGLVRAKTGTLSGVSSLAGVVVDSDGRLLAFAVLADRVVATGPARSALDSLATVLASCGCR